MPRIFRSLWPLLALIAIAAAGCSKPEAAYAGHYTGKIQLAKKLMDQLAKQGPQGQAFVQELQKSSILLDLKADKTFTISSSGGGVAGSGSASGNWTITNNQLVLTPTTSMTNGKVNPPAANQTIKLNPSSDKRTLTADTSSAPGGADNGSLTFTKS